MDVGGERLHVGEPAVGLDAALGVALALPGVVDVDVDITRIPHAGGDHGVGCGAHVGVGDLFGKVVPAVPSHGRRGRQLRGLRLSADGKWIWR